LRGSYELVRGNRRLVSDIARNKSATVREVADKTVARPIQIREESRQVGGAFNAHFLHKMCTSNLCRCKLANTTFSHIQPARVVRSSKTLHHGRARRAHPKRCQPFFDPIHSFSARGQNADFWPLSKYKYRLNKYKYQRPAGKKWPSSCRWGRKLSKVWITFGPIYTTFCSILKVAPRSFSAQSAAAWRLQMPKWWLQKQCLSNTDI